MTKPQQLMKNILSDMKVELTEMFDRNFERKAFFDEKWPARKNKKAKGSLLLVRGTMRRSIRSAVKGRGVHFTSHLPYTELHNQGGNFTSHVREHTRRDRQAGHTHKVKAHARKMNMPKRQFIGDHKEVRQTVGEIIGENMKEYFDNLAKELRK